MTHKKNDPPWRHPARPGRRHASSDAHRKAASARAAAAGRRYPNLVDNMRAARRVARGDGR